MSLTPIERILFAFVACIIVALLMFGCSDPPQESIQKCLDVGGEPYWNGSMGGTFRCARAGIGA